MGDEDKQFDATPQKLERARKEGQVVKSKDLSTAIAIIVMFSFIYLYSYCLRFYRKQPTHSRKARIP